jgi:transglutaminase-like putative cysteine protease
MLLQITHETHLAYTELISESVMELRMVPRQEEGQHRLSFSLAVGPPTTVCSYIDFLGNTVHAFTVTTFHRQIQIVATSIVETDRPQIEPENSPDTWPIAASDELALYDYLQFGGPVVDVPPLRALADAVAPLPGEPLGAVARRLLSLVN